MRANRRAAPARRSVTCASLAGRLAALAGHVCPAGLVASVGMRMGASVRVAAVVFVRQWRLDGAGDVVVRRLQRAGLRP